MRPQQSINQPCTSWKHQRLHRKITLHTLLKTLTHPALTHFCAYILRHTPFSLTHPYWQKHAYAYTHTHTRNYISTLGVWQRRCKNQSGRPSTWMNRLWSKPHQRHIDDLLQTLIFLLSVGSGPLFAWGALQTSVTLAQTVSKTSSSLLGLTESHSGGFYDGTCIFQRHQTDIIYIHHNII